MNAYKFDNERSKVTTGIISELMTDSCVNFVEFKYKLQHHDIEAMIGICMVGIDVSQSADDRVIVSVEFDNADITKTFDMSVDSIDAVIDHIMTARDYTFYGETCTGSDAGIFQMIDGKQKFVERAFRHSVSTSLSDLIKAETFEKLDVKGEIKRNHSYDVNGSSIIVHRMSHPAGDMDLADENIDTRFLKPVWTDVALRHDDKLMYTYGHGDYSTRIAQFKAVENIKLDDIRLFRRDHVNDKHDFDQERVTKMILDRCSRLWPDLELVGTHDMVLRFIGNTDNGHTFELEVSTDCDHTGRVYVNGELIGHRRDDFGWSFCNDFDVEYEDDTGNDVYCYNESCDISMLEEWYETELDRFMSHIADECKTVDKFKIGIVRDKDGNDRIARSLDAVHSVGCHVDQMEKVLNATRAGVLAAAWQPPNPSLNYEMRDIVRDGSTLTFTMVKHYTHDDVTDDETSEVTVHGITLDDC